MIFKSKQDKQLEQKITAQASSQHETTCILALIAEDYLKEKKSKRRWGFLIKALIATYLMVVLVLAFWSPKNIMGLKDHTAVVVLDGVIGGSGSQVTASRMIQSLRKAFAAEYSKGVILKINSPGGTPVQSDQINAEMVRLRAKYPEKPLYAVVGDLCASGGYYIASAADEIYANPASVVGSIGVRMGSFGFVEIMNKLGVERRLVTAGSNKGMLDPFSPRKESDLAHAQAMLGQVHQQFITAVKRGRGERLSDDSDIFSGLYWSGEEAQRLGLIDDFGDVSFVAREKIQAEKMVDYSLRPALLDRVSRGLGVSFFSGLWSSLQTQQWY